MRSVEETPDPDTDAAGAVEWALGVYVEQWLADTEGIDPLFARDVAERVRSFALRGGKRLRGRFVWWGWRAVSGAKVGPGVQPALRLGAALELIQTCALIHDDVIDGSSLRRGAPALHVAFAEDHARAGLRGDRADYGRSASILAGDLAPTWADDLVANLKIDAAARARVHDLWCSMRDEMVAGQYLDMRAQTDASSSPERALHIAHLKTALYTVQRPLALGAALAGADEPLASALCSAGRFAGVALQLRDDLLGVFGDPSVTGRPSGEDIRRGDLTYLTAVARTNSEDAGGTGSQRTMRQASVIPTSPMPAWTNCATSWRTRVHAERPRRRSTALCHAVRSNCCRLLCHGLSTTASPRSWEQRPASPTDRGSS